MSNNSDGLDWGKVAVAVAVAAIGEVIHQIGGSSPNSDKG